MVLHHHASTAADDDSTVHAPRNARYGLILFAVYLLLYGGFVGIVAFRPEWMSWTPWGGVNLAILYGMALIVAAFLLALVYTWLCRQRGDGAAARQEARP